MADHALVGRRYYFGQQKKTGARLPPQTFPPWADPPWAEVWGCWCWCNPRTSVRGGKYFLLFSFYLKKGAPRAETRNAQIVAEPRKSQAATGSGSSSCTPSTRHLRSR